MKSFFSRFFLVLFVGLLVLQCQKERNEYFKEPDWVGASIFETLQQEGRFGLYLQLVDKTQYTTSLRGNGLWTVFAPNDDAVRAWLQEKNYASVDAVPASEASKIVAYSLVFNRYQLEQLSHVRNNGWDSLQSIKKMTAYYETIHRELNRTGFDIGDSVWVVSPTVAAGGSAMINANDNNYKFIPFYLNDYMSANYLGAVDYNAFYPLSEYNGRNIQRASVVKENISSGNGVIHEIDKVNEPLPNLENYLSEPEYSKFMSLIQMTDNQNVPYFITWWETLNITQYYQRMYPWRNMDRLFIKLYTGLALPIQCERYTNLTLPTTTEGEIGGYTLFAPNNDGVTRFFNEKLSKYYESEEDVPDHVWRDFINSQMTDGLVYPNLFHFSENAHGDFNNGGGQNGPRFDAVRDLYTDIRPASNGFFYGGDSYIRSRYFESVYTEIMLRSEYNLMLNAFRNYFSTSLVNELMKSSINGYPEANYSVLLIPDELLTSEAKAPDRGFQFTWQTSGFEFRHQFGTGDGPFAHQRMQRIMRSHVFRKTNDTELDFFSGGDPEYDGYGYTLNDQGNLVRYKSGKLQMIDDFDRNDWITVTKVPDQDFLNGTVYTIDKLMQYSVCDGEGSGNGINDDCRFGREMINYIHADLIDANTSESVRYFRALITGGYLEIAREASYTILMPNNDAIAAAQAARHVILYDAFGNVTEDFIAKRIKDADPEDPNKFEVVVDRLQPNGQFLEVDEIYNVPSSQRNVALILPPLTGAGAVPDANVRPILNFFSYHILPGSVIIDDGLDVIQFSTGEISRTGVLRSITLFKLPLSSTFLNMSKDGNRVRFSNDTRVAAERRSALVQPGVTKSNLFAPGSVLHTIDNYFIPPVE